MNKSSTSSQIISLPKGGGALHGIGETFSPDLHTGTGNFTVPLSLPPGRNGFQPQLNLVYSTGNGNGSFGLGWSLSVPGVSRKTSKGIPIYDDGKDVFILSLAEDLVPVEGVAPGTTRYRPRTEGLFARIDHHHDVNNDYWEVRSKDGLVSKYGTPNNADSDPATVTDPIRTSRPKVFAWKLTQTTDPFGNRIEYEYERDLDTDGPHKWDQLYLKRVRYADYTEGMATKFLVSVTFEYENRPDAFSEYRSGFEIRTRRRCSHIVVRTHADREYLVRTYTLRYLDQLGVPAAELPLNGASLLTQIKVIGHDDDGGSAEELPPLSFAYTRFSPERRDFFPITGPDLPPGSLARPEYELADLLGNGLPDVFQMNGVVRYWRNLGNGTFDLPRNMKDAPAGLQLADPGVQLIDADGNGRIDLLVTTGALSGYFPLRYNGVWDRHSFQRYPVAPSFNLEDPEVKLVDLDGDGLTDIIRSGSRMECFFNDPDPREAWHRTKWVERKALEEFPNVNFSDPRVKWADISGDGLQDIVLVYDGNIEYWPNLGHGNWGKRIHMENSPHFPYGYNPKRILVGDVDGDGLADIVYVDDTKVTLWINQSGNGWSDPLVIQGTPPVSDMDAVRLTDMLGSGISGVLWSRDFGGPSRQSMSFLDFTGGVKPYLLNEMDNHIGAVTRVGYASSTNFYVEDQKKLATRWITPLPFPVQVVAKVEVIDYFSKGKLTTEYRYHHGYWDGAEREFRGFGMVEQRDTESFEKYDNSGLHGEEAFFAKVDRQYFSPPTLSKTWFHQGPVGDEFGDWQELDWSDQYWSGDPQLLKHIDTVNEFLKGLTERRVKRDALRALRGSILRTELYALDGSEREERPYTVTEYRYGLREESEPGPQEQDRLHIFFPHQTGQRTTQWERGDDPMTQFAFPDDYDDFGQPRRQTQIACPRGWRAMGDRPAQPFLATRTRTAYASPIDQNVYIHDRVVQTISHEMTQSAGKTVAELLQQANAGIGLELIGHTVHFYDGAPFEGLDFGKVGRFGALVKTETLALTEDQLLEAYGDDKPPYLIQAENPVWPATYPEEFKTGLPRRAGYLFRAATPYTPGFYVAAERHSYDFHEAADGKGKGLIRTMRNPFGKDTAIVYDEPYRLLPVKVTDPVGIETSAQYDYRVLQPKRVTDANGSFTELTFTPLELLKATSVKGKAGEGDQTQPSVVMEYNFQTFEESPPDNRQPIFVHATRRVHHDTEADVPASELDETIQSYEYSDGFGRLLQTRAQAEDVLFGDPVFGDGAIPSDQTIQPGDIVGRKRDPDGPPNVVVSGWQIYDNKGRVVEKFEPFFSSGWQYRSLQNELDQFNRPVLGKQIKMFYDPRGHAIHTVNPDRSEQCVVFGVPGMIGTPNLGDPAVFEPTPWEAYTYDANDNTGRTHAGPAASYAHHWNTPSSIKIDALGRTVETIARNCSAPGDPVEEYRTRMTYDIRGNVLTITDALSREAFRHVYDLANRKLRLDSIDAGVRKTVFDAAGQVIEQRDGKGTWRLHGYDDLRRPARLWARDDGASKLSLRIRMEYGDGGKPDQAPADRAGNRLANRLGKLHKQYDEAGLLTFAEYDFKGNILEKDRQVTSDKDILAVFDPPLLNWQVPAFRIDWQPLAGISLENHATARLNATPYRISAQYDALNRVKKMLYPEDVDNERKALVPKYNRAGALERVSLDGATYVEHIAYNAKGQRTLIAYGNGVLTAQAYDPETFRLKRLWTGRYTKPGGAELTYRPAMADRPLQDFAYEYDLAGNILKIHERTPGCGVINTPQGQDALDRAFTYDAIYRLLTATGRESTNIPAPRPWTDEHREGFNSGNHGTPNQDNAPQLTRPYTEEYRYDPAGNLLSLKHGQNGIAWTRHFGLGGFTPQQWQLEWPTHLNNPAGWANPPGNRLTHVGDDQIAFPQTHFYDANGNLTQETTSRHFEWDHSGRMKSFRTQAGGSEPTVYALYLSDAGGQRVKKLVRKQGGQIEVTVYIDGIFEYQRIVQGNTTRENNTLHMMDNQSRIALVRVGNPFPDDMTPAVKYHLGDHLGSNTLVIDSAGNWINREEYTPYGETSFGSFLHKRYRFTGKERDESTDLYYHGARYFAPWLGRWVSADPLVVEQPGGADLNVFAYVRGRVIIAIDPKGLDESCPGGTECGGGSNGSGVERVTPVETDAQKQAREAYGANFNKGAAIGKDYGEYFAWADNLMSALTYSAEPSSSAPTAYSRMSNEQKASVSALIAAKYSSLPSLPTASDPETTFALQAGFREGAGRSYEKAMFEARAVWWAGEVAIALVLGKASAPGAIRIGGEKGYCGAYTLARAIREMQGVEISATELFKLGTPRVGWTFKDAKAFAMNYFTGLGAKLAAKPGGFTEVANGGREGFYAIFLEGGSEGGHVVFGKVTRSGLTVFDDQLGRSWSSLRAAEKDLGMVAKSAHEIESITIPKAGRVQ